LQKLARQRLAVSQPERSKMIIIASSTILDKQ
jgi:hypothetical protein